MSGEHSPKSPIDPTGEEDKDKHKNDDGKPEDEKQDESSGSKGKNTTRNPLIHDEFFVTFMNTVINRQDL